jgi:hypothetical protein
MKGGECFMAEGYNFSVQMMDWKKQKSTVTVKMGLSMTGGMSDKSDNLKKLLEKYSYAKAIRRQDSEFQTYAMPKKGWFQSIYKGFDLVDQKALIIMREKKTGDMRRFTIPAPKSGLFYYVEKAGLRVVQKKGDDIAEEYSKVAGVTCEFVEGWFKSKK